MKKLLSLLLTSVCVSWLSMSVVAQEGSGNAEPKEAPGKVNAEKAVSGRWSGIVMGKSKSASTLTVRRKDGAMRTIHYDGSTQWTSQEHHSMKANTIDDSQVNDTDRVICVGFYDEKGEFHAVVVSKRLSNP